MSQHIEYQKFTVKDLMKKIRGGKLYLPAIQRKFVWDCWQIEHLFDSIMRDYPIGTFLFWMVEDAKKNDYSFYEFIQDYHERDNWKNKLAAKPHLPDELIGVLDGQQRLNSMYVALQGTYAYKRPWVRYNNPRAYEPRKFYLNLFKPAVKANDEDYLYEFRFLTPDEAQTIDGQHCWFLVKTLLESEELADVNRLWTKKFREVPTELTVSEETQDAALSSLTKLWQRLTATAIINYFPVRNQNLDEILDIFVRTNSAGTRLAKTDLLFSTIVAAWEDGREHIENFLQHLNSKGNGFWFDTDFMMRACLVLAGCPVQLRVASFRQSNVRLIVEQWQEITAALEGAVDLLVKWGFQGNTLTSANAVIPIAFAIKAGCDMDGSEKDLRLLFIKSLLTGVYGGQSDQVLASIRKYLEAAFAVDPVFSLDHFQAASVLPAGKSVAISEEALSELLNEQKGARSFALLSLLTPHLNFHQVQFHQDHIHPYSGFNRTALRRIGLETEEKMNEWEYKGNALPNLHLLEGSENISKNDTAFDHWLNDLHPDASGRASFLRDHSIPDDVSLTLGSFEQFYARRREVLHTKLAKLLDVAPANTASTPVKQSLP